MNKKKKARIRLFICSIPFVLFILNALIQIPICMHYDYPMPMLGIDAMNWFDAWKFNVGLFFICSLIILIPSFVIMILSIMTLRKKNF